MKSVLFFRHGKSDWKSDFDHDFERPLAKRGKKAARRMGAFLDQVGEVPDLVYTSPAVRASDTVYRAAEAGHWDVPIHAVASLYEAPVATILQEIRAAEDTVERLMLVGHEPSWSEAVGRLVGGAAIALPTAALARVDFEVPSWRDVDFGGGTLIWLVTPKLLTKGMK